MCLFFTIPFINNNSEINVTSKSCFRVKLEDVGTSSLLLHAPPTSFQHLFLTSPDSSQNPSKLLQHTASTGGHTKLA